MLHWYSSLKLRFHQWQVGKHSSVFVMEVLASAPYFPMLQLPTSLRPVFLSQELFHPPPNSPIYRLLLQCLISRSPKKKLWQRFQSSFHHPGSIYYQMKLAFSSLLHNATTATKARLLAESVPQWLRTVPSPGLCLALEPDETHILLKWWLGLPLCNLEETCPYGPSQLDPLGHHALTCCYAGDVVTRHNCIRDCIADFCCYAHFSPLLEQGCGIGPAKDRSCPADILIANWSLSQSAAFDIKVIHSLNNSLISDAGQTSGASAAVGEQEKFENNALGCLERGWICVPLVVEAYGGRGITAKETLSRIARRLAIHSHSSNSEMLNAMYCHLGTVLMRQNVRAFLSGKKATRSSMGHIQNLLLL